MNPGGPPMLLGYGAGGLWRGTTAEMFTTATSPAPQPLMRVNN